jgi:hypothetical protein
MGPAIEQITIRPRNQPPVIAALKGHGKGACKLIAVKQAAIVKGGFLHDGRGPVTVYLSRFDY